MKIKVAGRHVDLLGKLARCGSVRSQLTVVRTAAVLGMILEVKGDMGELEKELFEYRVVDDRTVFFLLFHERKEADTLKDAAISFSRYCAAGLDVIMDMPSIDEKGCENVTVSDIVEFGQRFLLNGRQGVKQDSGA